MKILYYTYTSRMNGKVIVMVSVSNISTRLLQIGEFNENGAIFVPFLTYSVPFHYKQKGCFRYSLSSIVL